MFNGRAALEANIMPMHQLIVRQLFGGIEGDLICDGSVKQLPACWEQIVPLCFKRCTDFGHCLAL